MWNIAIGNIPRSKPVQLLIKSMASHKVWYILDIDDVTTVQVDHNNYNDNTFILAIKVPESKIVNDLNHQTSNG